jgi:hypothetical protein
MVQKYISRIGEVYEYYMNKTGQDMQTWARPTREEWGLDMGTRDMSMEEMVIIGKARYIYYKTRCKLDYGQRKTMNLEHVIEELKETLEPMITRTEQRNKKQRERQARHAEQTRNGSAREEDDNCEGRDYDGDHGSRGAEAN